MNLKRVVIAGLGDAGVLAAIRLARWADVIGISAKPGLVSGQELGIRLAMVNSPKDELCGLVSGVSATKKASDFSRFTAESASPNPASVPSA
jgi:hypothetical protein